MGTYLLRKVLRGSIILLAASFFSFLLCELAPGDFFAEARLNTGVSMETVDALRNHYGMHRPFLLKYAAWLSSIARGEWGISFTYGAPAAPILFTSARNTLLLTITAGVLSWGLALLLAIAAEASTGSLPKRVFRGLFALLLGIPDILLILVFTIWAARTGVLPVGGMTSPEFADLSLPGKMKDLLEHMILPVVSLTLVSLPVIFTHASAALEQTMKAPYMTAARAAGISGPRLLFIYGLRGASNPLITLMGFSFGTLLSSSLIVEAVAGWPGIGRLLLDATLQRDSFLVIGSVMLSASFMFAGNLLTDLMLYASDPRIRMEGES